MTSLKRTPLHSYHLASGARMAPFAGYDMPISYDTVSGGMMKEHLLVRQKAGIFDVSHMGEFWVRGKEATKFLSYACTRSFEKLAEGKAQYCLLLNENGSIIDDIIVYKFNSEKYWVVVNASNTDKDFAHLEKVAGEFDVALTNVSEETSLIAIQGPEALRICSEIIPGCEKLKYYSFMTTADEWIVARTGYTGEDGFEIFLPNSAGEILWHHAIELGALPIGLGARDTLRLEVGFSLYGHELSEELRPSETFSAFAVESGHRFIGSKEAAKPARYLPLAIQTKNPKPIRADEALYLNGQKVGWVTSGSTSPIKRVGIGLALVEVSKLAMPVLNDSVFMLESAGKQREAVVTKTPFVETARVKAKK